MRSPSPEIIVRVVVAALPAALAGLVALALAAPAGSLDDVFVVLSDARGWLSGADGAGLGRPPVEATTSPLDLLIKAGLLAFAPAADPLRSSGWVEVVMLGLVAVLAVAEARRHTVDLGPAALVAAGVVLAPGLVESASYRLEGPLFAFLWLGTVGAAAAGRGRATLIWTFGLVLARPEGLLLGPVACWLAGGGNRRLAGRLLVGALGMGLAVTLARLALYGSPVPNTFFAKSSSDRLQEVADGARYLSQALTTWGGLGLVGLAAALMALMGQMGAAVAAAVRLLVLAGVAALVVIVSGGDSYLGARLALPVGIPVWLAGAALWRAAPRAVLVATAVALALQVLGAAPRPWPGLGQAADRVRAAFIGGPVGLEAFEGDAEAFDATARALAGETFAHRHVQRFRWFEPGVPVLDLTGITDREVARMPTTGRVLFGRDAVDLALDRRVGAIHLDPARARPLPLAGADLVRALSDPAVAPAFGGPPYASLNLAQALAGSYRGASFELPQGGGYFNLLVRVDLADRFRAVGFEVGRR